MSSSRSSPRVSVKRMVGGGAAGASSPLYHQKGAHAILGSEFASMPLPPRHEGHIQDSWSTGEDGEAPCQLEEEIGLRISEDLAQGQEIELRITEELENLLIDHENVHQPITEIKECDDAVKVCEGVAGEESNTDPTLMTTSAQSESEPEPPTCLICFETFAEDLVCSSDPTCCKSYVFSSAIKKNKKTRIPCRCQQGKDQPDFIHQQCLWTWQNKLSKNTCPLCRQVMYDPRIIFREAFLSSTEMRRSFLTRPVKEEWGVVQCAVDAEHGFGSTRLLMRSQETGSVLLEARRTSSSSMFAPEYGLFANEQKIATLSSNLMGTTWSLRAQDGEDLLCIQYSINRAWLKEPRKMRLLAPGITQEGEQVIHHRPLGKKGAFASILNSDSEVPFGLEVFQNRFPHWNEEMEAYCLNFGGRVRLASVKNFQIMHGNEHPENAESETLMQFGRVDKEKFHLDVQFPFSPVQAFAACVSSYYGKLGVE